MLKLIFYFIVLVNFNLTTVKAENSFKGNDFSLHLQGGTNINHYSSTHAVNIVFINDALSIFTEVSGDEFSYTKDSDIGNIVRIFDENRITSPSKNRQTHIYYLDSEELVKVLTLLQKIKKLQTLINKCLSLGDAVGTLILKTSQNRIHICIGDANKDMLDLIDVFIKISKGKLDFLHGYGVFRGNGVRLD